MSKTNDDTLTVLLLCAVIAAKRDEDAFISNRLRELYDEVKKRSEEE